MDLIDARLGQRLTTPDLAAAAGVSASHFTRLFREPRSAVASGDLRDGTGGP